MKLEQIDNVVFEDIDHKDAPDYSDAYIVSADLNGVEMTEEQIEKIPDVFKYDLLQDYLH